MGVLFTKCIQAPRYAWIARMFIVFTLLAVLTHCKKGDTGPAGPAGPAGSAGPQGPKGDTGVANVIYSAWLDVVYLPDTIHIGSLVDTIGYYVDVPAPKLTPAILTNGEMRMYLNFGTAAAPNIVPLPYLDIYSGASIDVSFQAQKIALYANTDAGTRTGQNGKILQYRYVLIPGAVQARRETIDWANYRRVQEMFNIPD